MLGGRTSDSYFPAACRRSFCFAFFTFVGAIPWEPAEARQGLTIPTQVNPPSRPYIRWRDAENVCLIMISLWERFCGNRRRPSGITCRVLPGRRVVFAGDKPQRYISLATLGCRCWVTVVGVVGRRRNPSRIGVQDMLSYQSPMPAVAGTPRYGKRELWFGTANRHGRFC